MTEFLTSPIQAFSPSALNLLEETGHPSLDVLDDFVPTPLHHKVYNFEVSGTHTYIADSIRVHNRSVLSFIPDNQFVNLKHWEDSNGDGSLDFAVVYVPGTTIEYEKRILPGSTPDQVLVETTYSDENGSLYYRAEEIDSEGNTVPGTEVLTPLYGQQIGENVLGALTPFLTTAILDEDASVFEHIAADTVLGTGLENLGEYIGAGIHRTVIDQGDQFDLEHNLQAISDNVFADFGGELIVNGVNSTISIVNQLIMAEIFEAVNIDGIPGAVFESFLDVGLNAVLTEGVQSILQTDLMNDIISSLNLSAPSQTAFDNFVTSNTVFDQGFSLDGSGINPISIIVSAVLGEVLPTAETIEGQIANTIASTAFSIFASVSNLVSSTWVAGPVGMLVGAVVGLIFDRFFEDHPEAWSNVGYDETLGEFVVLDSWENDGGNIELSREIAQAYVDTMNGFVEIFESESNNYGDLANWVFGHYEQELRNGGPGGRTFRDVQDTVISAYVSDMAEVRLNDGKMVAVRALEELEVSRLRQEYDDYGHMASVLELLELIDAPEAGSFTLERKLEMPGNLSNGMTFQWTADQSFQERLENFLNAYVSFVLPMYPEGQVEHDITLPVNFDAVLSSILHSMPFFSLAERPIILRDPDLGGNYVESWEDFLHDTIIIGGRDGGTTTTFHPTRIIGDVVEFSGYGDVLEYLNLQGRVFYSDTQLAGLIASQLEIADNYHDYLEDSELITAMIASSPDDAFAAGWFATLMAVEDTGLNDAFTLEGDNLNNVFYTASGDDSVLGMSGSDTIKTYGGDDFIDGGSGSDYMTGGVGDDVYVMDSWGDRIYEDANGGIDLVQTSVGMNLNIGAQDVNRQIENIELTGSSDIHGTGNIFDNTIDGNTGNNQLNGLDGDDTLYGRAGEDVLKGGAGNDLLNGGGSADSMTGGTGDDIYVMEDWGDRIYENANGGIDLVRTSIGINLNNGAQDVNQQIENIELTGSSDINGTGNTFDNTIDGNTGNNQLNGLDGDDTLYGRAGEDVLKGGAGNDLLNGGGSADSMTGGTGDDIYVMNDWGDLIYENEDGGIDLVQTSIGINLNNGAQDVNMQIESIDLTGSSDINGTGNTFNNTIDGNTGNNQLNGLAGDDTLYGKAGNDTLKGGNNNDYLDGGTGDDILEGGNHEDTLVGGAGADFFDGGDGIDTVSYHEASMAIFMRLANSSTSSFTGEAVGDSYLNVENVLGSSFDDNLAGDTGDNVIGGGDGNDKLWALGGADVVVGDAGNDTLYGQGGNDDLWGGSGNDKFDFRINWEQDTIHDFEDDVDTIIFRDFGLADTQEALSYASQLGADVIFDFGGGDSLTVLNTTITALQNDINVL